MAEGPRFLVTGGAGLIGLEVCRQLAAGRHEVVMFDVGEQIERVRKALPGSADVVYGSILDRSSLREAVAGCDVVIHLAAMLGVQRSERSRLRCLEVNIEGTQNVLDTAVAAGARKIVFASSSEVYGEPLKNPVDETAMTQGKSVYAVSKLAGEELCRAYSQSYGIRASVLRFFNCYGSYQNAQFVIAKFIKNVMEDRPPVIYGSGTQARSYTHVEDTARAVKLAAMSDAADGEIINVGNSRWRVTLEELADIVIQCGGAEDRLTPERKRDFVGADRSADREVHDRFGDCAKAKDLLGWEAKVPLSEGIRRMFESGVIFDRWESLNDEAT